MPVKDIIAGFEQYQPGNLADAARAVASPQIQRQRSFIVYRPRANPLLTTCAMVAVFAFSPGIHAGTPDATPLLGKYNCQMCHDLDKKKMGPAYKSIARKYADQQGAAATLENIVRNGTKGTISMPPTKAPESDISAMVAWILDQK